MISKVFYFAVVFLVIQSSACSDGFLTEKFTDINDCVRVVTSVGPRLVRSLEYLAQHPLSFTQVAKEISAMFSEILNNCKSLTGLSFFTESQAISSSEPGVIDCIRAAYPIVLDLYNAYQALSKQDSQGVVTNLGKLFLDATATFNTCSQLIKMP